MPKTTVEKIAFNNTNLDNLKPCDKPYRVWDEKQAGLYVLVSKKGTITYYLSYILPGTNQRKDFKIGRHGTVTPTEAKKMARAWLGEVAKGVDIQSERSQSRRQAEVERNNTLGAFIENRYQAWALAHKKRGQDDLDRLNRHFAKWFNLPLTDISVRRVTLWQTEQLKKGRMASGINRDINSLRSVMTKAVEFEVIEKSPLLNLKKLKEDRNKRVRYLSLDEERRLRSAIDDYEDQKRQERSRYNQWLKDRKKPPLPEFLDTFVCYVKPIILLALNTGLRITEVMELQWHQVTMDIPDRNGFITVIGQGAKSGQTRHIPLTDEAVYALREWKKQCSHPTLIFSNPDTGKVMKDIKSSWKKIRLAAGLYSPKDKSAHFRFHDLRHSFASNMVMAGVELNHVREFLGHEGIEMTLKYAHLSPESKQTAMGKLDSFMKTNRQSMNDEQVRVEGDNAVAN